MTHDETLKRTYRFSMLFRYGLGALLLLPSLGKAVVEGISCTPEPTDMTITYGDVVNCQIDVEGEIDRFRFAGTTGETIRTQTSGLGGDGFPVFEVFGPNGTLICSGGFPRNCQLTQAGTHTILVSELANDQTVGYSLAIERIAPPSVVARPIDHGQVIGDEINGVGDIDAFLFGAEANDVVRVQTATLGGNGFPVFEVFGPNGTLICSGGFPRNCQLTQAGAHTILVAELSSDQTVQYSLTLECIVGVCPDPPLIAPPPPPVELEPATPQTPIPCTDSRCRVPSICNLPEPQGTACTNRIDLFVRRAAARFTDVAPQKAPKRIRFASGIANVPPGEIAEVRLRLTKKGKEIVRTSKKKRLTGILEIRNAPGTAIDTTAVKIRLRRR